MGSKWANIYLHLCFLFCVIPVPAFIHFSVASRSFSCWFVRALYMFRLQILYWVLWAAERGLPRHFFFWCLVLFSPQLLESILHQSVNSSSFTCKYFSMCFLNTENMCRILINRIYYLNGAKSMKLFAASVGLCGLLWNLYSRQGYESGFPLFSLSFRDLSFMLKSSNCWSLRSFGVCCEEGNPFTLMHTDGHFPITGYEGRPPSSHRLATRCCHKHLSFFKVI